MSPDPDPPFYPRPQFRGGWEPSRVVSEPPRERPEPVHSSPVSSPPRVSEQPSHTPPVERTVPTSTPVWHPTYTPVNVWHPIWQPWHPIEYTPPSTPVRTVPVRVTEPAQAPRVSEQPPHTVVTAPQPPQHAPAPTPQPQPATQPKTATTQPTPTQPKTTPQPPTPTPQPVTQPKPQPTPPVEKPPVTQPPVTTPVTHPQPTPPKATPQPAPAPTPQPIESVTHPVAIERTPVTITHAPAQPPQPVAQPNIPHEVVTEKPQVTHVTQPPPTQVAQPHVTPQSTTPPISHETERTPVTQVTQPQPRVTTAATPEVAEAHPVTTVERILRGVEGHPVSLPIEKAPIGGTPVKAPVESPPVTTPIERAPVSTPVERVLRNIERQPATIQVAQPTTPQPTQPKATTPPVTVTAPRETVVTQPVSTPIMVERTLRGVSIQSPPSPSVTTTESVTVHAPGTLGGETVERALRGLPVSNQPREFSPGPSGLVAVSLPQPTVEKIVEKVGEQPVVERALRGVEKQAATNQPVSSSIGNVATAHAPPQVTMPAEEAFTGVREILGERALRTWSPEGTTNPPLPSTTSHAPTQPTTQASKQPAPATGETSPPGEAMLRRERLLRGVQPEEGVAATLPASSKSMTTTATTEEASPVNRRITPPGAAEELRRIQLEEGVPITQKPATQAEQTQPKATTETTHAALPPGARLEAMHIRTEEGTPIGTLATTQPKASASTVSTTASSTVQPKITATITTPHRIAVASPVAGGQSVQSVSTLVGGASATTQVIQPKGTTTVVTHSPTSTLVETQPIVYSPGASSGQPVSTPIERINVAGVLRGIEKEIEKPPVTVPTGKTPVGGAPITVPIERTPIERVNIARILRGIENQPPVTTPVEKTPIEKAPIGGAPITTPIERTNVAEVLRNVVKQTGLPESLPKEFTPGPGGPVATSLPSETVERVLRNLPTSSRSKTTGGASSGSYSPRIPEWEREVLESHPAYPIPNHSYGKTTTSSTTTATQPKATQAQATTGGGASTATSLPPGYAGPQYERLYNMFLSEGMSPQVAQQAALSAVSHMQPPTQAQPKTTTETTTTATTSSRVSPPGEEFSQLMMRREMMRRAQQTQPKATQVTQSTTQPSVDWSKPPPGYTGLPPPSNLPKEWYPVWYMLPKATQQWIISNEPPGGGSASWWVNMLQQETGITNPSSIFSTTTAPIVTRSVSGSASTQTTPQIPPNLRPQYEQLYQTFMAEGMSSQQASLVAAEALGLRPSTQATTVTANVQLPNPNAIDPNVAQKLMTYVNNGDSNGLNNYVNSIYKQIQQYVKQGDYTDAYVLANTLATVLNATPNIPSVTKNSINQLKDQLYNAVSVNAIDQSLKTLNAQLSNAVSSGDPDKTKATLTAISTYLNEASQVAPSQLKQALSNLNQQLTANSNTYIALATVNAYATAIANSPDAMNREAYLSGLQQYLTQLKQTDPRAYKAINGDELLNNAKQSFAAVVYSVAVSDYNQAQQAMKNNDYDSSLYWLNTSKSMLQTLQSQEPNTFKRLGLDKVLSSINNNIGFVTAVKNINDYVQQLTTSANQGNQYAVNNTYNALKQYLTQLKQTNPQAYSMLDNYLNSKGYGGVNGLLSSLANEAYGTIYNNLVNQYNTAVASRDPLAVYDAAGSLKQYLTWLKQNAPSVYRSLNGDKLLSNVDTTLGKINPFVSQVNQVMQTQHINDPKLAEAMLLSTYGEVTESYLSLTNAQNNYAINPTLSNLQNLQSATNKYYDSLLRLHNLLPNDPATAQLLESTRTYVNQLNVMATYDTFINKASSVLSNNNPTFVKYTQLIEQYQKTNDPTLLPQITEASKQLMQQLTTVGATPDAVKQLVNVINNAPLDPSTKKMMLDSLNSINQFYGALTQVSSATPTTAPSPAVMQAMAAAGFLPMGQAETPSGQVIIPPTQLTLKMSPLGKEAYLQLTGDKRAAVTYDFLSKLPEPLASALGFTYGMGEWINTGALWLGTVLTYPVTLLLSTTVGKPLTFTGELLNNEMLYKAGLRVSNLPAAPFAAAEGFMKQTTSINRAFTMATPSISLPATPILSNTLRLLGVPFTSDGKVIKLDPVSFGALVAAATLFIAPTAADIMRGASVLTSTLADPGDVVAALQRMNAPKSFITLATKLGNAVAASPETQAFLYTLAGAFARAADSISTIDLLSPLVEKATPLFTSFTERIASRLPKVDATGTALNILKNAPATGGTASNIPLALRGLIGSYLGFALGSSIAGAIPGNPLPGEPKTVNDFYKQFLGGLLGALLGGGALAFGATDIIRLAYADNPEKGALLASAFEAADNMGARGVPAQLMILWDAFTHAPTVVINKIIDRYYMATGAYPGYGDLLTSIKQAVNAAVEEGNVPPALLDAVKAQAEDLALHGYVLNEDDVRAVAASYLFKLDPKTGELISAYADKPLVNIISSITNAAMQGYERGLALRLPLLAAARNINELDAAFRNGLQDYLATYYGEENARFLTGKVMSLIQAGKYDEARDLLYYALRPGDFKAFAEKYPILRNVLGTRDYETLETALAMLKSSNLPPQWEVNIIEDYLTEYLTKREAFLKPPPVTVARGKTGFGWSETSSLSDAKQQLISKLRDLTRAAPDTDVPVLNRVISMLEDASDPGAVEVAAARAKVILSTLNDNAGDAAASIIIDWTRAFRDLIYSAPGDAVDFASKLRAAAGSLSDPHVKAILLQVADAAEKNGVSRELIESAKNQLEALVKAPTDDAAIAEAILDNNYRWYGYSLAEYAPTASTTQATTAQTQPTVESTPSGGQVTVAEVKPQLPMVTATPVAAPGTVEDIVRSILEAAGVRATGDVVRRLTEALLASAPLLTPSEVNTTLLNALLSKPELQDVFTMEDAVKLLTYLTAPLGKEWEEVIKETAARSMNTREFLNNVREQVELRMMPQYPGVEKAPQPPSLPIPRAPELAKPSETVAAPPPPSPQPRPTQPTPPVLREATPYVGLVVPPSQFTGTYPTLYLPYYGTSEFNYPSVNELPGVPTVESTPSSTTSTYYYGGGTGEVETQAPAPTVTPPPFGYGFLPMLGPATGGAAGGGRGRGVREFVVI